MSSRQFGPVRFVAHPQDHEPRHVHGFMSEAEVIVDLLTNGSVALASRRDAIRPGNAKRSDVRRIMDTAAEHFEKLVELWESMHDGKKTSRSDDRR
jgi:hypothetical protein